LTALKPSYIPTLDGWRAAAILAVMAMHDRARHLGPLNDDWLNMHGVMGVRVFFAISGILICSRLLAEQSRFGRISLRSFYIRRAFRILPPAILFLLVAAILIAAGHSHERWRLWWASLLFYRNFFPIVNSSVDGWVTSHYWSLSLEEQFYLLLPALLVFCHRWRTQVLAALIVLGFAWTSYAGHHFPNIPPFRPDVALNLLFIPALAAILLRNQHYSKVISWIVRPWPLYLLLIYLSQDPDLSLRVGLTYHGHLYDQLLPFVMTALVLSTALHPKTWLGKLLETAPIRWIGRISYSLYLWQQIFLTQHYAANETFSWVAHYIPAWPLTFACAALSYYLVERPMIRLGHRLTKNPVPDRPTILDDPPLPLHPASV
jgi:peptidoglycan/LPS O-acetylase OafA/YrhL